MTRFNLDSQIASIPSVVRTALDAVDIPALDPTRPVSFVGVGTSLHAARIASDWVTVLSGGAVISRAVDAHDYGTWAVIRKDEQAVVISHRGTKTYPHASLRRARDAGASTIAVVGEKAPEQAADVVLRSCPNETAGTFSVSYIASLTILAQLAGSIDTTTNGEFHAALSKVPDSLETTLTMGDPAAVAADIKDAQTLLIAGFGIDLATAHEAALKIKEGAWMWTEGMSPEFALHGTPASYHPGIVGLLIDPAHDDGGRMDRLERVLEDLGMKALRVARDDNSSGLAFTTPHPLLQPMSSIVPFQRLTAELARVRGTDPDRMHGGREPWQSVMTGITL
ncbi:SIS domain-containing protein [Actinomycetes bacterium M1A6_2h]